MKVQTPTPETELWDDPAIVAEHINPDYTTVSYLHYADLNEFIKRQAKSVASVSPYIVLDYGAGSSPYQKYFPGADYRRADIAKRPGLHYCIRPDSTVDESDDTIDVIISTQVAEHVINPKVYFKECFRLLKLGGVLILTTHGVWQDHGSPYDFQRWTADGLERDLADVGFKNPDMFKLTCGIRAALLIFTRELFQCPAPESALPRLCFKIFRTCYSNLFGWLYRLADEWFASECIVPVKEDVSSRNFYLVVAAVVRK